MDDGRFNSELDTDGSDVKEIEDVDGEETTAGERERDVEGEEEEEEKEERREECRGSLLLVCLGSPRVFSACIAS
jgi:hypothetical protein